MPAYNASPSTVGAQHGVPAIVWNNETPAAGSGGASASQAVALPDTSYDKKRPFSVAIKFALDAAGFEVDVQVADVDADKNYQTIAGGNLTTYDATNFTVRADVPDNTARFARLLMRTQVTAGSVALTATITP